MTPIVAPEAAGTTAPCPKCATTMVLAAITPHPSAADEKAHISLRHVQSDQDLYAKGWIRSLWSRDTLANHQSSFTRVRLLTPKASILRKEVGRTIGACWNDDKSHARGFLRLPSESQTGGSFVWSCSRHLSENSSRNPLLQSFPLT